MQIECPHCQTLLEVSEPAEAQVACPNCGGEISIAAEEPEIDAGEHLDSLRIRQLAAERRATNRARSYCIIAMLFCAAAVIQFTLNAVRSHSQTRRMILSALAAFALYGAVYFIRMARRLSA